MGTTWYYALQGALPMWTGCLINGFFAYGMFSVAHDGLHRAISSNSFVNELVGGIGLLFLAPYAPMQVTRWIHMQHHRFTNEKIDPDRYTHDSPIWQMPIRWSNFDLYYFIYFLRNGGEVRDKHLLLVVGFVAALVAIIGITTFAGFGVVTHREDPFLASTMRMGWEWLLTPLLVYQNYHLIHHLYPTVPFYKIHDVWYLKYDELSRGNVSYQSAFGITPENIASHSPKL